MANYFNITGTQGETLLMNLTCTNSDGTYINLSGYGVRGYSKINFAGTGILLNLNPQIISYISGMIQISGSATGIAAVPSNTYPYDIECYASGGSDPYTFKPIRGYLLVFPETCNL
jgi:hypothetical protein